MPRVTRNRVTKDQAPKRVAQRKKEGMKSSRPTPKRHRHSAYQEDLPAGYLQTDNPDQCKPVTDQDEVNAKDHSAYQEDLPSGYLQTTNPNQNLTY